MTSPPFDRGESIHLCVIRGVSGQVQYISPAKSLSPVFTVIVTGYFFSVSRELTSAPSAIKAPETSSSFLSGLSMPSKMLFIIPGPRVADIGAPVEITGSSGISPVVPS